MPSAEDVYIKCDDLDDVPSAMRNNYLSENELLSKTLNNNARVLQIGSLDGRRIISLLKMRPDLSFTGLEIEEPFIDLAKENLRKRGLRAKFILGDITKPPVLPKFDYVICLNNTLGYIPDQQGALAGMAKCGNSVIVSVYGGEFTNHLAKAYFKSIGLHIDGIENDTFTMKDFTTVKRFSRKEAEEWGVEVVSTPVGYFCISNHTR